MAKNNAKLIDPSLIINAGINPKNGLPVKFSGDDTYLRDNIRKVLRIKDEQTAITRYTWYNTGLDLSSQEIERFLYYKYKLAFFYLEGKFYLMPYALNGGIDFYGRENVINPVPFNESNNEATKRQKELLSKIRLTVRKGVVLPSDLTSEDIYTSAVIVRDYSPQLDINNGIPRATLQDPVIDLESKVLPYMRTARMNSTGVIGVKANDEGEYDDILEGAKSVDKAALNGTPWIPLMQKLDRQDLNMTVTGNMQDYLLSMQGIDNFRESLYGLNNGGMFRKKEHTNDSENALNNSIDFPLTDGLKIRQDACNIINSIWNIGIWCEISETALGMDVNGDFKADDSNNQSGNVETGESNNEQDSEN